MNILCKLVTLASLLSCEVLTAQSAEQIEFFEKKIRPYPFVEVRTRFGRRLKILKNSSIFINCQLMKTGLNIRVRDP